MFKITYFHTLYKKNVSANTDHVSFQDGCAKFASGGHRYSIEVKYLVSIEELN